DERSWVWVGAVLHDLTNCRYAGCTGELAKLGELGLSLDTLREYTNYEPALRLRLWGGIGLARGHPRIMPVLRSASSMDVVIPIGASVPGMDALGDRLAARTLELVA